MTVAMRMPEPSFSYGATAFRSAAGLRCETASWMAQSSGSSPPTDVTAATSAVVTSLRSVPR